MVGLCLAHQLLEREITSKIVIFDKEKNLGIHSSGRNSGVLHAIDGETGREVWGFVPLLL